MFDIFSRVFAPRQTPSKNIANERLRMVLIHDRASVSPQFLESLKGDMMAVISKYAEIDEKETVVNFSTADGSVALVANIPIKRVKRGSGINRNI
ncbi:MAG TPA: cell division topological specificity factor MinE [Clostridia bacterium]|nr:cell division topological specificity factor MinE [Clostridia bacterium]